MFKNTMVVLGIAAVAALCSLSYKLGESHAETKYVIQEKEVVRYEKNCAIDLVVQPSVDDDAIAELFDAGRL